MKKILSLMLVLCMALSLCAVETHATYAGEENTADALNSLNLFLGYRNDKNGNPVYGLGDKLTREQGVLLLLRMLGKIDAAETAGYTHPFNDVTAYYTPYIAYAYQTGLTKGTTEKTFGSGRAMTEHMFLTFCLRALEYTDGEQTNYVWKNAYALARANGLLDSPAEKADLLRADAVELFWNALKTDLFGGSRTLAQKLIGEGVFSEQDYLKACAIEQFGKEAAQKLDCDHRKTTSTITVKPTCTESGVRTYYCAECGVKLYNREIPALGHSEEYKCNAEKHWLECSICGEKGAGSAHSFNSGGVCKTCGYGCTHNYQESVTAPTCTAAGYTTHTCSKCGYQYKDTYTPAAEHDYVGVVTKKAACTETGITTYTCSRCGDHYNETIEAKGHTPVTDPAVAPTCTAAGKTEGSHCSECGAVLTAQETVSSLGHDYVNGECTRCHAKDPAYVPPKENKGYETPAIPM